MAFYGWPISQCQFLANPLVVQLQNGIRVLDIRLGVSDGQLLAYHGIYPQRTPFKAIVQDLYTFLTSPEGSSETVVMSMKQEDAPKTSTATFSQMVHLDMMSGPGGKDFWFTQNRIPRLGEVRGKVVLFSRFAAGPEWEGGYENSGIHPTNWPDSPPDIFTWQCKNTLVRTSDW
jgi:1-phosphatidylinositol phosphodiesterase